MASCNSNQPSETMQLFQSTMDIHNEAMAKMEDMYNLKMELKTKIDSIKLSPDSINTSVGDFHDIIDHLEQADEAMMVWMPQFEIKYKDEDNEENQNYYKDQKAKITKINEDIDQAIAQAKSILDN